MAKPAESTRSSRPLSIRAFAEASETSPRRIRRLIRQGRLSTLQNQAGEVRIPESELERVLKWKESRALRQSMEMQSVELVPVSSRRAVEKSIESQVVADTTAMNVPIMRHEAALMRLGYLESEFAATKRVLKEIAEREAELRLRADQAEQDAISATVRAVEAENRLEEMRAQVIESTFKAVELGDEVKRLRDQLMAPWWKRLMDIVTGKGPALE